MSLNSIGKQRGAQLSEFAKIVGYDPTIWQKTDVNHVINMEISSPEEYVALLTTVTDIYDDLFRKVFYEIYNQL
jgi:hypothetical protein